ncbi:sensor histidine kinase [Paludibaculum fermentans]|uniref:sensor histidine kinase n=1 Tax=Paludibaculum fermentans TaxID=1473598 RepID=UPI003EBFCD61
MQLSDDIMSQPSSTIAAEGIVTKELLSNLYVVLSRFGLDVCEIYISTNGPWRPFWPDKDSFSAAPQSDFCKVVSESSAFRHICEQDHDECCNRIMQGGGAPITLYCPFGLSLFGLGFQVGPTKIVLRSVGWLERGNEGLTIKATLDLLSRNECSASRSEILSLLQRQPARTMKQLRDQSKDIEALIVLVRDRAQVCFDRNIDQWKDLVIQDIRKQVLPLMSVAAGQDSSKRIREALSYLQDSFRLDGVLYYFSNADSPTLLTSNDCDILRRPIYDATLIHHFLQANQPAVIGEVISLQPEQLKLLPNAPSRACSISYPESNTAFLAAWHGQDTFLDNRTLGTINEVLSAPLCLASLTTTLRREATLRATQARNNAHTVRSTFQAIMGDSGDVRVQLGLLFPQSIPSRICEPLEHMEEMLQFTCDLLQSNDVVIDSQNTKQRRASPASERVKLRLTDLVNKATGSFAKRATAYCIRITQEASFINLPAAWVHPKLMTLVFVNVLHNALKYSHRGSKHNFKSIVLSGRSDTNYLYVDISDFGVGIHPLEHEVIFEPFCQGLVVDRTREIDGQGIGLAAAREICRQHGGFIRLKECIPYEEQGRRISREELCLHRPDSQESARLLEHCCVIFEIALPIT